MEFPRAPFRGECQRQRRSDLKLEVMTGSTSDMSTSAQPFHRHVSAFFRRSKMSTLHIFVHFEGQEGHFWSLGDHFGSLGRHLGQLWGSFGGLLDFVKISFLNMLENPRKIRKNSELQVFVCMCRRLSLSRVYREFPCEMKTFTEKGLRDDPPKVGFLLQIQRES